MEALLQPGRHRPTSTDLAKLDFPSIEQKLKCKGMTRQLLWEEYAEAHPGNHYCYSRFTALFRRWRQTQQLSMRQTHRASEKLFVDYCGSTLAVVNPDTGETRRAQVFVAVLGGHSSIKISCCILSFSMDG